MKRVRTRWLMAALLLLLPDLPACAQPSTAEFLPEIDAYVRLNSNVRLAFQAKETLKEGDLTRIEQMLENMFIGRPPGNYDRLLDFSRAIAVAAKRRCL